MAALTAKSMFPICKDPSREERYQICSLLKAKQTISEIARLLGRSRSTVSRNESEQRRALLLPATGEGVQKSTLALRLRLRGALTVR